MKFNLELLDVFINVVDSGSINAAARKLSLCPSNISKKIRRLERDVGKKLVNRSRKGITLTNAGNILYEYSISLKDRCEYVESIFFLNS